MSWWKNEVAPCVEGDGREPEASNKATDANEDYVNHACAERAKGATKVTRDTAHGAKQKDAPFRTSTTEESASTEQGVQIKGQPRKVDEISAWIPP